MEGSAGEPGPVPHDTANGYWICKDCTPVVRERDVEGDFPFAFLQGTRHKLVWTRWLPSGLCDLLAAAPQEGTGRAALDYEKKSERATEVQRRAAGFSLNGQSPFNPTHVKEGAQEEPRADFDLFACYEGTGCKSAQILCWRRTEAHAQCCRSRQILTPCLQAGCREHAFQWSPTPAASAPQMQVSKESWHALECQMLPGNGTAWNAISWDVDVRSLEQSIAGTPKEEIQDLNREGQPEMTHGICCPFASILEEDGMEEAKETP
nr:uncharacterized protein LOC102446891 [Pelodiscus sinensis]|eukprot:XP_014424344.1 uncharacterized protein LOC102446891 [Pelodiscus sinensis]